VDRQGRGGRLDFGESGHEAPPGCSDRRCRHQRASSKQRLDTDSSRRVSRDIGCRFSCSVERMRSPPSSRARAGPPRASGRGRRRRQPRLFQSVGQDGQADGVERARRKLMLGVTGLGEGEDVWGQNGGSRASERKGLPKHAPHPETPAHRPRAPDGVPGLLAGHLRRQGGQSLGGRAATEPPPHARRRLRRLAGACSSVFFASPSA